MQMMAAVLYQTGQPLVIEKNIEIPALQPGQVLVKIAYSGLCNSQLMEVRGKRGKDQYLPHLLGHEGSGEVIAIGEKVTKVRQGDLIVLGWIKGEGIEVPGSQYHKNGITINAGAVTTFNEYAVVSENRCVKIPDGTPMDLAVLYGCALPTGAGIVINTIQPEPNSSIAIFGLGGIGLSALLGIRLYQTKVIIAIDVEESKLALAKKLGATHIINATNSDPVDEIYKLTNNQGIDYSIEAAGQVKTIEQAFSVVKKGGGRCVFASHPPAGEKIQLDPHDLISGRMIEGSWGGGCFPDRDIKRLGEYYREGKLPIEHLLSHQYSLGQINQALNDLENKKIVRALIKIGS